MKEETADDIRQAIQNEIVRRQEHFYYFVVGNSIARLGSIEAPVEDWWLYHGIVE